MPNSNNIKTISSYIPFPACVVNNQGKILEANERIGDVFIYDGILNADIFALTGVKITELYNAAENELHPTISRNDRVFKMVAQCIGEIGSGDIVIMFNDVTNLEDLKDRYNGEKPCLAKIQLDNYDELLAGTASELRLAISSQIDKIIRKWSSRINGSVNRVKNNSYIVWFEQQYLEWMISNKFEILDEIRNVETGVDFPASLSIGVGAGGKNLAQTEEYASAALDLALGRGGDQAVVKRNIKIEYFGGKLQTVEKSNKGKSRIVGHALKQLIDQSKKIFIMGHSNPDMDCFGASLGIMRLCYLSEKEPYLVIDDYNESLSVVYKQAKDSDDYKFITSEKALSLADADSLVIVLDTHRPSLVQCRGLLDICDRIVVIDHHRKVEEFIENPVLAYMESYASSTSELVSEILQYMSSKKSLVKLEAEALLAGITVDTNNFAIKTGVRTFDAAAWLRRQGADPAEVKRFFQENIENVRLKARALASAQIHENGVAIAECPEANIQSQVMCAQIADQLLTVKGVKASFVIGINMEGRTVISARSLGDVNVQLIMEKFNGGGHLTTAAAQVDMSCEEVKSKIMEIMEAEKNDSYFK